MTATERPICPHGRYTADGELCNECEPATPVEDDRRPIHWPTFWAEEEPENQWTCEPFMTHGRAGHIYSPRAQGKSSFLLYTGAGMATGRPVLDTPAGEGIIVAYIDLEMSRSDLRERLTEFGYGPQVDMGNLAYWIDPPFGPLDRPEGAMKFIAWVREVEARAVIVDSISRCISGEENSNDTYDALYTHAISPLKRLGIGSMWAGNSGKDRERGSRGGSRKEDVMDYIWRLERGDDGAVALRNTKKRSAWMPDRIDLQRIESDAGIVSYRTTNPSAQLPAGSVEVAGLLDEYSAPLDITTADAAALLRSKGTARRRQSIQGGIKYRRWQVSNMVQTLGSDGSGTGFPVVGTTGNRGGNRPPGNPGNHAGNRTPENDF